LYKEEGMVSTRQKACFWATLVEVRDPFSSAELLSNAAVLLCLLGTFSIQNVMSVTLHMPMVVTGIPHEGDCAGEGVRKRTVYTSSKYR